MQSKILLETGQFIKEEYCCVTVGCMAELYYSDVEEPLVRFGGKPGWMRSVQHLLGFEFKQLGGGSSKSIPLSASLVGSNQGGPRQSQVVSESKALGQRLRQTGELDRIAFPIAGVRANITRTDDPSAERLNYRDSIDVNEYLCLYYWKELNDVSSSTFLFDYIEKQMIQAKIPWPNKGRWSKTLANRWIGGRASSALVRIGCYLTLNMCLMLVADACCLLAACRSSTAKGARSMLPTWAKRSLR